MLILKLKDFGSFVPRDFGTAIRDDILADCLSMIELDADDETRGIDTQNRVAPFVMTDPSLDSYNEVIDVGAFDKSLPQFMRNPVILPEHRRWMEAPHLPIVGHVLKTYQKRKKLLGDFWFNERPVGQERWQGVVDGDLRMCSVGFRPIEWDTIDKILHYKLALLKEVSTVPIGANDNALLVNSYIAGRFGTVAQKDADPGRVSEIQAAIRELQEANMEMRAMLGIEDDQRAEKLFETSRGASDGGCNDDGDLRALVDIAENLKSAVSETA